MIKYIADSVEWRDKTYGNVYASTRIISTENGEIVKVFPFAYGNGHNNKVLYARDNDLRYYEIYGTSQAGTRKQAEQWGKL